MRDCRVRFIGMACLFLAAFLIAEPSLSEEISVPGVTGTYVSGSVAGLLPGSAVTSSEDTYLKIEGSLVPGLQAWCTNPESEFPSGSEIHLIVYAGDDRLLMAMGLATLEATAGDFQVMVPVQYGFNGSIWDTPCPFDFFAQDREFDLVVGQDPWSVPLCLLGPPATVTIDAMTLVSADLVADEKLSWGSLKSLYR